MGGDVKEERGHLGSMHGPQKLPEAWSAAPSAPTQYRHLFPFLLFLVASFLPHFPPTRCGHLGPPDDP